MTPENLFVAPEGAMQFVLIPNGVEKSYEAALDWAEKECDVIWVHPEPLLGRCRDHPDYLVVMDSLPPKMRVAAEMKSIDFGGKPIRVCACMGHLIE